jgi:hypothetical protein
MSEYDSPEMREWTRVHEMHKTLASAFEPLIRNYYAKAVGRNPREFDDMSVEDMVKEFPFTLPRNDDGMVETADERTENWRQAVLLDTMRLTQMEMTGGDDSVFDYLPDGIEQMSRLANFETLDWIDEVSQSLTQYRERHTDDGPYFMDCTSSILYQVFNDDEDDK